MMDGVPDVWRFAPQIERAQATSRLFYSGSKFLTYYAT